jgi:hypothetical protein
MVGFGGSYLRDKEKIESLFPEKDPGRKSMDSRAAILLG